MKRILAILLLSCLLLNTGCCCIVEGKKEPAEGPNITEFVDAPEQVESVPATEPDAEPEPEMVTVYLIDEIVMADNGSLFFEYDEAGNVKFEKLRSIEGDHYYTRYYEDPDENGMPRKIRTEWIEYDTYSTTLSYFADGKIEEEMSDEEEYTGYQYSYDLKGDLVEKREYYEGILQNIVICEYDGEELTAVYCEDANGTPVYEAKLENGRIVEIFSLDPDYPSAYIYAYDENGNLLSQEYMADGMRMVVSMYSYKTIEVDYDRAQYLLKQQNYILSVL